MPRVTWIKGSRGSWAEILLGSPAVRSAERCWSVATVLKQGGGVTGLGPHGTEPPLDGSKRYGENPSGPLVCPAALYLGKEPSLDALVHADLGHSAPILLLLVKPEHTIFERQYGPERQKA